MVEVNGRCNAGCRFCELSKRPPLDEARLEELKARLRADREAGAHRLRLSGGEPMLERNLTPLVAFASELGYETILLETNGSVASLGDYAARLVQAGVTDVLWAVNAPHAARNEEAFRMPGAHESSIAGARALMAAGARLIARTPMTAASLEWLADMPAWLRQELPDVAEWWLRPLVRDEGAQFSAALLPPLAEMAEVMGRVARRARLVSLPLQVDDEGGLPLCAFKGVSDALGGLRRHPHRDRRATHTKADACSGCAASSDCPGQPLSYAAEHGPFEVKPFSRVPMALIARKSRPEKYVIYDHTREVGDHLRGAQVTIRVIMPCNQDCTFCFVDRSRPGLGDDEIFAAIDKAAADGASRISFSGGEPTLHRRLAEFVARAKEHAIDEIELQSNALTLGDPALTDRLVEAGVNQAVVSLHAVDPVRYLAITGAGTPDEVIAGVRNLLDRGVRVELNVVHNHDNLDHLADVVDVVAARIPEAEVLFSVTYIVDGLPRDWAHVAVRYSDAVPHLVTAMRRARDAGLAHRLTGRCGTPPCTWRGHLDALFSFKLLEMASDEPEPGHAWVDACEGCSARSHCYGVNQAYLARFGGDEFQALDAETWAAARG